MQQSPVQRGYLKGTGFFCLALIALSCSGSKQAAEPAEAAIDPAKLISYEKHIAPMMVNHCTPCHFPEKGKKEMLDTYDRVADHASVILRRVQLPAEDEYFMPYKGKKPAWSEEQIEQFKTWVAQKKPK